MICMNVLKMNEMTQFKNEHDNDLMAIPGVIGCGVGIKNYINEQITAPCINLYVENWTSEVYAIHEAGEVLGVPVKVISSGPLELL